MKEAEIHQKQNKVHLSWPLKTLHHMKFYYLVVFDLYLLGIIGIIFRSLHM